MPDPDYTLARERAIASLYRRRTSSGGIVRYLIGLGFDDDSSRQVAEDLIEAGYIDDHAYARDIIRARQGRRAESIALLDKRLQQRGVPAGTSAAVLAELREQGTGDAQLAADWLRASHRKELTLWKETGALTAETRKLQLKIKQRAARHGFSPELVDRVLRHWGVPTD